MPETPKAQTAAKKYRKLKTRPTSVLQKLKPRIQTVSIQDFLNNYNNQNHTMHDAMSAKPHRQCTERVGQNTQKRRSENLWADRLRQKMVGAGMFNLHTAELVIIGSEKDNRR